MGAEKGGPPQNGIGGRMAYSMRRTEYDIIGRDIFMTITETCSLLTSIVSVFGVSRLHASAA